MCAHRRCNIFFQFHSYQLCMNKTAYLSTFQLPMIQLDQVSFPNSRFPHRSRCLKRIPIKVSTQNV